MIDVRTGTIRCNAFQFCGSELIDALPLLNYVRRARSERRANLDKERENRTAHRHSQLALALISVLLQL